MINIRNNVFETNSSSTHSIAICTKSDYEDFVSKKLYYVKSCKVQKHFVSWEELIELINTKQIYFSDSDYDSLIHSHQDNDIETVEEILFDNDICTIDTYFKEDLESFEEEFTTPNGETVVAFGYYGYDG